MAQLEQKLRDLRAKQDSENLPEHKEKNNLAVLIFFINISLKSFILLT